MRTLFRCPHIRLEQERYDERAFNIGDLVTINLGHRLVDCYITMISFSPDSREVILEPAERMRESSAYLTESLPEPATPASKSDAWLKGLIESIEGARGPVLW